MCVIISEMDFTLFVDRKMATTKNTAHQSYKLLVTENNEIVIIQYISFIVECKQITAHNYINITY
jgi:hypothetical protein